MSVPQRTIPCTAQEQVTLLLLLPITKSVAGKTSHASSSGRLSKELAPRVRVHDGIVVLRDTLCSCEASGMRPTDKEKHFLQKGSQQLHIQRGVATAPSSVFE
jgi:hypothetical protein